MGVGGSTPCRLILLGDEKIERDQGERARTSNRVRNGEGGREKERARAIQKEREGEGEGG